MKNIHILIAVLFITQFAFAQSPCIDPDDNTAIEPVSLDVQFDSESPEFDDSELNTEVAPNDDPCFEGPSAGQAYYDLYDQGYQRDLFLVHGLEGDGGSWDNMVGFLENGNGDNSEETIGWKVNVHTPDYNLNQTSLWSIGAELEEEIMSFNLDEILCDNIAICHSMGGLAARVMDQNLDASEQEKPWGAIITFATSHQGAIAAEKLINGEMDDFIVNSCAALTSGPLKEFEESSTFFDLLGDVGLLKLQELKDQVCATAGSFAFEQIKARYTAPVVNDLAPNSENLQELQAGGYDPQIRRIPFYGIEEDEGTLAWRFFYSAIEGVNTPGMGVGGATDDEPGVVQMHKVQDRYIKKTQFWEDACEDWLPNPTCFPIFKDRISYDSDGDGILDANRCFTLAETTGLWISWSKGQTWTLTFNNIWKTAIGQMEPTYECQCVVWDPETAEYEELSYEISEGETCDMDNAISCNPVLLFNEEKLSDGLVLVESQINFPGSTSEPIKLDGSNHLQMRNDNNTIDAFTNLLDGHIDWWIYTPRRD